VNIKKGVYAMVKLALRYARYAFSMLASLGFGVSLN